MLDWLIPSSALGWFLLSLVFAALAFVVYLKEKYG